MTPASTLSRAADLIRDTAAAATPGPWAVDDPAYVETIYAEDGTSVVAGGRWGGEASVFNDSADARWIALMSPAVAPAIEALLREYARCADELDYAVDRSPDGAAALALARAVLGEKEETDG